jgi:hypothetical protein
MKTYLLTILFFAFFNSYGQTNIFESGGNVGIGTSNPINKLTVFEASENNTYATIGNNAVGVIIGAGGIHQGVIGTYSLHDLSIYTGLQEKMRVTVDGKVGIGTTSPSTTLYVQNDNSSYAPTLTLKNIRNNIASRAGLTLENDAGSQTNFYKQASGNYDANDVILYSAQGDTRIYTSGVERLRITSSGNIGIGTSSPKEALSVNGNIRSKQIKVEEQNWPDYVFKPGYNLLTLSELKNYIDLNQHLPNMPSEQDVSKNGLNLGEIVKLQTQKIEELTLYLIEKDRQVAEQNKRLKQQEARLAALEAALSKLITDK